MFPGLAGHLAPIIVNLVFAGLLYMRTQIYRARLIKIMEPPQSFYQARVWLYKWDSPAGGARLRAFFP